MPTISSFLFESAHPAEGPRLLIFGAIHGNEPCGPQAIEKIMKSLKDGALLLERGSVRFVPICNQDAYAKKVRFVEQDLNRVFRKTEAPETSEAHTANELCALVDTEADAFLDVHSSTAQGPTSVFIDYPTPENKAFAEALGMEYALLDWPKVYEENAYGFDSYDTTRYAYEKGIPGIIVECGQHNDPNAVAVAEKVILRTLKHFKMISFTENEKILPPRSIYMKILEKKTGEGDSFEKEWKHLEPVAKGERIAIREGGQGIYAKEDSIILLPKPHAQAGQEWFYLGILSV